jgi:ferritin-like metal-binding protein YciE
MSPSNLEELLLHALNDTYDAEKQIVKALRRLSKSASTDDLKRAFAEHAATAATHIARLERIFDLLHAPARGKRCGGMKGLLDEGTKYINEFDRGVLRDAALIGAVQKVEHYEIAAYNSLLSYAYRLELGEAFQLLQETFAEERDADERLMQVSAQLPLESAGENRDSDPRTRRKRKKRSD